MKPIRLAKGLILLWLNIFLLACGGGMVPEEQAKIFLTLLQKDNINKCAEMVYYYQENLQKIMNEPQFKQSELIANNRNEIKEKYLNERMTDSIVYIFRFPCQWQILETKQLTQESTDLQFSIPLSFYRVFALVKYNSISESPDSVPLLFKEGGYKYKVKEVFLHCDFEKNTGLYLGWGIDQHSPWENRFFHQRVATHPLSLLITPVKKGTSAGPRRGQPCPAHLRAWLRLPRS